jgi:polar amino acid transport system substrate-binding protein
MLQRIAALSVVLCMAIAGAADAATPAAATVAPEIVRELAPTGTLRAAINLGNAVMAQKDERSGKLGGVTVELANELGKRLGVPVTLVPFEAAGKVFEAMQQGQLDVAFIAVEPARAAELDFTAPYVLIEATYMVRSSSPLKTVADVDRPGVRIAVGRGSAYDLYLTRTISNATIVRSATGGCCSMIDLFVADKLEAVAGVRQQLVAHSGADPSMRIMADRFMDVPQAVAIPKGRKVAPAFLRAFVEEMKSSGFVANALRRSGQVGALVAPAAP